MVQPEAAERPPHVGRRVPPPHVGLHEPHDQQRHVADEEVRAYVGVRGDVDGTRREVPLDHAERLLDPPQVAAGADYLLGGPVLLAGHDAVVPVRLGVARDGLLARLHDAPRQLARLGVHLPLPHMAPGTGRPRVLVARAGARHPPRLLDHPAPLGRRAPGVLRAPEGDEPRRHALHVDHPPGAVSQGDGLVARARLYLEPVARPVAVVGEHPLPGRGVAPPRRLPEDVAVAVEDAGGDVVGGVGPLVGDHDGPAPHRPALPRLLGHRHHGRAVVRVPREQVVSDRYPLAVEQQPHPRHGVRAVLLGAPALPEAAGLVAVALEVVVGHVVVGAGAVAPASRGDLGARAGHEGVGVGLRVVEAAVDVVQGEAARPRERRPRLPGAPLGVRVDRAVAHEELEHPAGVVAQRAAERPVLEERRHAQGAHVGEDRRAPDRDGGRPALVDPLQARELDGDRGPGVPGLRVPALAHGPEVGHRVVVRPPQLVEAAERLERLRAHLSVGAAVALDDREVRPAGLLVLGLP